MRRQAQRSAGRGSNGDRARILLAEDDYDLRRVLEEVLTLAGYDVHAVASGTALLEELASCLVEHGRPADVMVTDIRMPGCNGLSIVDGLRAAGWKQPILVISAFGDAEVRARIKRLGVEFMAKPIDPDDLERTLSRMCAQAS